MEEFLKPALGIDFILSNGKYIYGRKDSSVKDEKLGFTSL